MILLLKGISNPYNTINIMIIYSLVKVIIFYSNIIITETNKSKQLSPFQ